MKRIYSIITFCTLICSHSFSQESRQISDCTVTYDVSVQDSKADPQVLKTMAGAIKTVYIKGFKSRSDLETSSFKQSILFDAKTDSTVVLKEVGGSKYISYLNGTQRNEKNIKYQGIQFSATGEKKTILGYDCQKVIAKLTDGTTYNVYYTTAIIPTNTNYEYQFKSLAGFVMEYEAESENGKTKVKYQASKITLSPVPNARFDIPKSGYRVL